jgi:hypothetical protein
LYDTSRSWNGRPRSDGRNPNWPARPLVEHREQPVGVDDELHDRADVEHRRKHRRLIYRIETVFFVGLRHDGHPLPPVVLRDLPEDSPSQVDRRKQRRMRQQHLGLAEEEHSLIGECEVEARQHPALRLGVEVHQRIAADQKVDARNRCVLNQVVAAEDHRPAQVLVEHEPIVLRRKVLLEPRCRHGRHLLLRVDGRAHAWSRACSSTSVA